MSTTQKVITTAIVLVIITALLYTLTPKNPPTPPLPQTQTNFDGSTSQMSQIEFVGKEPQLPTQLPVLQINNSSQSAQFLPAMIQQFQLQPIDTGYWQSDLATMTFDPESNTYTLSTNAPKDVTKTVSIAGALSTIDSFLTQHGLQSTLQPNQSGIQFFSGEYELDLSPPSLAEYIQIPYSRQFNQIPIIEEQRLDHSMIFLVDGQNQIKKITFHPFLPDYQPQEEKSLITIADAVKNINNGQGAIIAVSGEATFPDFSQIKSGNMENVVLEYRTDGQANTARPYYHFSGTGTNQAGETLQLHIITPALNPY